MDVESQNEWISVIVCAPINSAVLMRMEALSSVPVRPVKMNVYDCHARFVGGGEIYNT